MARAEQAEFPSAERFNYLLDVLNNGSTSEDKVRHKNTNYNDQDRYEDMLCFCQYLDQQHCYMHKFQKQFHNI